MKFFKLSYDPSEGNALGFNQSGDRTVTLMEGSEVVCKYHVSIANALKRAKADTVSNQEYTALITGANNLTVQVKNGKVL